ncbi:membrane proteinlike, putative [Acanthamoeba castellanii str. Neff]|uniref:Membrane proteinlike, putative n=1 Tax=Acanthamoeba castellanii (strain ATCC 30010 / Neff) TaxID=1257118 RepID=L8H8K0_ACACF|nr:membrane proteinlike, putative [Acanthamoeba castellanii str. Neff]ELR21043.1 membrane proteinlike, putative [Acanthamoeba castellanii str. Neff]
MSAVSRRPKGVISSGKEFNSFEEFFPFYMQEHSNRTNRRLHFIGTSLALLSLAILTFLGLYKFLFAPFVLGYGFAWVGHFFIEKNKPATFKHPFYSLMGDFQMWYNIITGKQKF